jgi:ABC-type multidrug transport system fused ATPase/permease subunit
MNDVLAPPHGRAANLHALYEALAITCAALILSNLAIYYQTYLTAWSGQHLIANLRVRLFERILNLPLDAFDRWRPGELMSRFSTDLQLMTDAVSVSVPQLVVALVTFVSSFAIMIYFDAVVDRGGSDRDVCGIEISAADYGEHASLAGAHRRSVGEFGRGTARPTRGQSL